MKDEADALDKAVHASSDQKDPNVRDMASRAGQLKKDYTRLADALGMKL